MKILVDAVPMTGLLTGIARHLRNLYLALEGIDGTDITYFDGKTAFKSMPPLAESAGYQRMAGRIRKLPDPAVFALRAARWLKYEHDLNRLCRKKTAGPFDIYHETAFTPAKFTRAPTVFYLYDLSLRRYKDTQPRERVWLFEYFIGSRLRYAAHILTISEFVRREIIDEFNVSPSKVTAIPLASDPLFEPCSPGRLRETRRRYGLPEEYLLFVGTLEPRKNIDLLVGALEILKIDIPLVLVGWHGWGEKRWLDKIAGGAVKNRIYLTGHVPDADLQAIYTGAAALVFPSLYEGFGLPIVEAMACGCPVICSNASSMPEVAGDAAVLIDPENREDLAEAIETVVGDTEFRKSLVDRGGRRASRFTWEATARKTLDLFKRVAETD